VSTLTDESQEVRPEADVPEPEEATADTPATDEAIDQPSEPGVADEQPSEPPEQPSEPSEPASELPEHLKRVLKLSVPLVVCLSEKQLQLGEIMRLGVGSTIEFDNSCADPLDLRVNNQTIGSGEAVKVGENFGLKITSIFNPQAVLKSLNR